MRMIIAPCTRKEFIMCGRMSDVEPSLPATVVTSALWCANRHHGWHINWYELGLLNGAAHAALIDSRSRLMVDLWGRFEQDARANRSL